MQNTEFVSKALRIVAKVISESGIKAVIDPQPNAGNGIVVKTSLELPMIAINLASEICRRLNTLSEKENFPTWTVSSEETNDLLLLRFKCGETAIRYYQTDIPLFPKRADLRKALHYWVEFIDIDGRGTGLKVYQWQPGAKAWCLPNNYATGIEEELRGYVIRGRCYEPPFQEERQEFVNTLMNAELQSRLTDSEKHIINTYLQFNYPPKAK
jgi:hypothetical protein